MIRKSVYKMELYCTGGTVLPITIATTDIQRIEPLVEQHCALYSARGYHIERFVITDTRYLLNIPEHDYEQEIMFCDIVDDADGNGIALTRLPSVDLAEEFEVDANYQLVRRRK